MRKKHCWQNSRNSLEFIRLWRTSAQPRRVILQFIFLQALNAILDGPRIIIVGFYDYFADKAGKILLSVTVREYSGKKVVILEKYSLSVIFISMQNGLESSSRIPAV